MARRSAHFPRGPQAGCLPSGADIFSSESYVQPPDTESQLGVSAGQAPAAAAAAADHEPASAAKPPPQQAASSALSMLTAALTASPTKPANAAEPAAAELHSARQQHGSAAAVASAEAGLGQWPRHRPSAPSQASRPLPRRVLGSGGRSGDPVLLESFLNAGMHVTGAEVRGALVSQCTASPALTPGVASFGFAKVGDQANTCAASTMWTASTDATSSIGYKRS